MIHGFRQQAPGKPAITQHDGISFVKEFPYPGSRSTNGQEPTAKGPESGWSNCVLLEMRVIGEIPHPQCKITLFHWNNRYLIKLEQGLLEQTYKVQEWDLSGEGDLTKLVSDQFIKEALGRFQGMENSLREAVGRV